MGTSGGEIIMAEIKYKTLSGKEFEVSGDFKCFGMKALWSAFESCKQIQKGGRA
jgi:hypothetical protein